MDATVTKEKHPGRVAQGHKLVALNRERKKALKEQTVGQPAEKPVRQPAEQPAEQPQVNSSQVIYAGSGVIVVAALLAAWYFLRKKPAEVQTTSPLKKHDIYSMR